MTEFDQEFYWYWFVNIPGIGNKKRIQLMEHFGHPSILFECKEKEISSFLAEEERNAFLSSRNAEAIERGMKHLKEEGYRFIHWDSKDYPFRFRNLYDPPYGFYLRGRLPDSSKAAVAIVGSRRATQYGRKMAQDFAKELASHDVVIISGMAAGIDSVAHRTALSCRGETLGLLGGGIDTMYPKENWNLYLDMYQMAGVMSEYNLGVPNHAGLFPMRNRLISGLSDVILVVEAGLKSGSLITADQGMEQGKEVYAVPGRLTDPMSKGCNHLIAQGAMVAESPFDLLDDLSRFAERKKMESDKELSHEVFRQSAPSAMEKNYFLSEEERSILNFMDIIQAHSFEELLQLTGMQVAVLQHFLVEMELKGLIFQCQQHMYLKKM